MAEFLPIIMFSQRDVDNQAIEAGGDNRPRSWFLEGDALADRSQALVDGLLSVVNIERKNTSLPYLLDVQLVSDDTSKTKRKAVAAMFDVPAANDGPRIIGMHGSENLLVQARGEADLRRMVKNVSDMARNVAGISCVKRIAPFKPEVDINSPSGVYKVKLVDYKDERDNEASRTDLKNCLDERGLELDTVRYTNELVVYKMVATRDQTMALMDSAAGESIFSIQPMPRYRMTLDALSEPYEAPDSIAHEDGREYPRLGILDSGIEPIGPLSSWLIGERYSPYLLEEQDHSHGTFVAGIAQYGDQFEHEHWIGGEPLELIDANVFPDEKAEGGYVDETEVIENIREALARDHDEATVWNLSISGANEVKDNDFSDFAKALDALQDEYGILICKSAGNTLGLLKGGQKERLSAGADSVRSLTVGSAAHEQSSYDFSKKGEASPFSCIGPGPEFIIKPEISHYGGNAGINPRTGEIMASRVHSFATDGRVAADVGTSFSTPRVSALAANLVFALDSEPDPLLIKTLIIHSANFADNKLVPSDDRVRELGFGIPQPVQQILSSNPYESTLVLRGKLEKREKVNILGFPMPPSLIREGVYTGQIILTLVYNPILDESQGGEYCQSNIDVKFGSFESKKERDTSKQNIINPIGRNDAVNLLRTDYYSRKRLKEAQSDFALKERMLIQFTGKYAPVKKYAVDLSDLKPSFHSKLGKNRLWFLELDPLFRYNIEMRASTTGEALEQQYCLAITIRDPMREAPVYDEVVQQLNINNFLHEPVKIRNQARSYIGN